ncbi:hypothetical protein ASA1KI_39540 [Opitutales bacterium ASA1]|nr:hypothetical protein ASA1KI_39540 [Opitutales bacterium ASA1]
MVSDHGGAEVFRDVSGGYHVVGPAGDVRAVCRYGRIRADQHDGRSVCRRASGVVGEIAQRGLRAESIVEHDDGRGRMDDGFEARGKLKCATPRSQRVPGERSDSFIGRENG